MPINSGTGGKDLREVIMECPSSWNRLTQENADLKARVEKLVEVCKAAREYLNLDNAVPELRAQLMAAKEAIHSTPMREGRDSNV